MYYTIGEMAKKLNIPASTLRYYDKEGLLPFVERTSGNIRKFTDTDLEWLNVINCLKETGMSIKDIKIFIEWCLEGDSSIGKRLDLVKKQRETMEEQMKKMQHTLDTLAYKVWYYETAKAAGTCKVHDTLDPKDIPAQFRKDAKKGKDKDYPEW